MTNPISRRDLLKCAGASTVAIHQFGSAQTTFQMVFGYFGEHNLYIPTRENVPLDLYQSQAIREQYTCPVGWSLDVEDEMIKGTVALVGAEVYPDPRARKSYPLRRTGP